MTKQENKITHRLDQFLRKGIVYFKLLEIDHIVIKI